MGSSNHEVIQWGYGGSVSGVSGGRDQWETARLLGPSPGLNRWVDGGEETRGRGGQNMWVWVVIKAVCNAASSCMDGLPASKNSRRTAGRRTYIVSLEHHALVLLDHVGHCC